MSDRIAAERELDGWLEHAAFEVRLGASLDDALATVRSNVVDLLEDNAPTLAARVDELEREVEEIRKERRDAREERDALDEEFADEKRRHEIARTTRDALAEKVERLEAELKARSSAEETIARLAAAEGGLV